MIFQMTYMKAAVIPRLFYLGYGPAGYLLTGQAAGSNKPLCF